MSLARGLLAALCLWLLLLTGQSAAADSGYDWRPPIAEELPVILIQTKDGSSDFLTWPNRDAKLQGSIEYVDAVITVTGGGAEYDISEAPAQVKARGNYTLDYPKKSIRIKFEEKQAMLGLHDGGKYKNWVLLAEWKDLSMTHSPVAMYLAHAILGSDGYYVTDCRNVEVWLNGEYWGLYLLAEQQEVKTGRTSLPETEKGYAGTDIGYFFEYDAYFAEERALGESGDPVFEVYHEGVTQEQYGYTVKSDVNARQKRFLTAYVRRAYQIVHRAIREDRHYGFNEAGTALTPISSTSAEETVGQVLDLRSLTDMYILAEIVCNPDLAWSSFYITLDRTPSGDGRLVFEAPWDFDSAFGIRSDYEQNIGFYVPGKGNPWLDAVANEAWFQRLVRARWAELKERNVLETALQLVIAHRDGYAEAYARNYQRWPERIIEGNHELVEELNRFTSQAEAADYLYRWLKTRLEWLDGQWSAPE